MYQMSYHEFEIEKQYILSDHFLVNILAIPKKEELTHFSLQILPINNPYFSKFIYQDIITYSKDDLGIKSISRVRHEISSSGEEKYLLSFKHGSFEELVEKETEISKEEFLLLLKTKQTELLHLEKLRYEYPIKGTSNILEIDVFTGKLAGMHVGEVEFHSIEDMKKFIHPQYIIKDITDIGLFSQETIDFFSNRNHTDYSRFIK